MCGAHNSKFIIQNSKFLRVVPGRLELPTSTLSVWRSNQLSYRTGRKLSAWRLRCKGARLHLSLVVVLLNKTVLREARDLWEVSLVISES